MDFVHLLTSGREPAVPTRDSPGPTLLSGDARIGGQRADWVRRDVHINLLQWSGSLRAGDLGH